MVAQIKLRHWLQVTAKLFGPAYGLVLALLFVSPDLSLSPALLSWLERVFIDHTQVWLWGVPGAYLLTALVWLGWLWFWHWWAGFSLSRWGVTRVLLPRADVVTKLDSAVQFWNQASDLIPRYKHICYGLTGTGGGVVQFHQTAERGTSRALITQAMADWPGLQSQPVRVPEAAPLYIEESQTVYRVTLQPKHPERPLQTAVSDPVAAPLVAIARLPGGVQAGVLVLVRGDSVSRRRLGTEAARETAASSQGKSLERKRQIKAADERARHVFLECQVQVWAAAAAEAMAHSTARSLARTVMAQYEATNPLVITKEEKKRPWRRFPLFAGRPWTDAELATLAHLEGKQGAEMAPQLALAPARALPPSPESCVPRYQRTAVSFILENGQVTIKGKGAARKMIQEQVT